MTGGGNEDSKWGGKKMEGEECVRTVDCLRGRLLAERVASRNAKEEAEQMENKLMELENLLKQEAKSRNRAEKKLKFLMKKLESINISYVSDESEYSGLVDKSDISSVSSTTSSSTKELQENNENQQMKLSKISESQESKENDKSQKETQNLQQNDSQNCLLSLSDDSSTTEGSSSSAFEVSFPELKGQECEMGPNEDPRSPVVSENFEQNFAQNATVEDSLSSAGVAHSEKSSHLGSNQNYNDSKMDEQSDICYRSVRSSTEEGLNQEDDQDPDNSMALVPVDMPQKNHTIDPEVLDATVKEVLDALRHAKEQLQSSMERRRMNMIKVG
ncbi:hypothetical protein Pfo_004301 [Paulownia fortunei]|nr:hypothetical protein Pfo_004301 [Paulownia fortunei]